MQQEKLFCKGKLYKIHVNNFQYDANGSVIPVEFNFISPVNVDKKYYYINWKESNIKTFFLNDGDVLMCLDETPKTLLYINNNGSFHIGGETIGFLFGKNIVIPWYNYIYENNVDVLLSKHIKKL